MLKTLKHIVKTGYDVTFSGKWLAKMLDVPAWRHDSRWQKYCKISQIYSKFTLVTFIGVGSFYLLMTHFEMFIRQHDWLMHLFINLSFYLVIPVMLFAAVWSFFMVGWDIVLRKKLTREIARENYLKGRGRYQNKNDSQSSVTEHNTNSVSYDASLTFSEMHELDDVIVDYFGQRHQQNNETTHGINSNAAIEHKNYPDSHRLIETETEKESGV
jgi:hypothetical protein